MGEKAASTRGCEARRWFTLGLILPDDLPTAVYNEAQAPTALAVHLLLTHFVHLLKQSLEGARDQRLGDISSPPGLGDGDEKHHVPLPRSHFLLRKNVVY